MRPRLLARLASDLEKRRQAHALRQHLTHSEISARHVVCDGRRLLNFSSNDYLGLSHHPRVLAAARQAIDAGVGAGASHLITGHHHHHQALQEALADWQQRDAAVLFSTGYMANLGVIQTLCGRHDLLLQDRLNHASLIDAAALSGSRLRRYRHHDVEHLRALLSEHSNKAALIASDGVFSMDGDVAPVESLARLAKEQGATLMLDDAHGIGVLGAQGRGAAEQLSQQDCPVLMGTLGKAFGTFGAFVTGSQGLIEGLTQFARSHIYTTAPPPAWAAATLTALALIRGDDELRQQLHANIQQLRNALNGHAQAQLMPSQTAIQPLLLGDNARTLAVSQRLEEAGFRVAAIRPPTVPEGSARLRITLSAAHQEQDIKALVAALDQALAA